MEKDVKSQSKGLDVDTAFDRAERYFNENRKSLLIIVGAVVGLVAVFFAWKNFYQKPREKAAEDKSWRAEQMFIADSFAKALKGGKGDTLGFERIIKDYGSTSKGNLAQYYTGISLLHTGKYKEAIEHLKEFESDDMFVGTIAIGAIGDAYMELNQADEAISYYLKAAQRDPNVFTSPIYLKKAGIAYEDKKQNDKALEIYRQIKKDYPNSPEAALIDKYIARAGGDPNAK